MHACNDASAALEILKITTAMASYLLRELARLTTYDTTARRKSGPPGCRSRRHQLKLKGHISKVEVTMALGRHFRAERELRADDRCKRYNITDEELALTIAKKIPGDRLNAIVTAVGMVQQVRAMNEGTTPIADAVDEILDLRRVRTAGKTLTC